MLEREIKFRIPEGSDPVAVRRAIESAGFRLESSGSVTHDDRYLDTEDWLLYRAGIALRLRHEGTGARLEVKTIRSRGEQALERMEWSQAAPPDGPPWRRLPVGAVASLLRPLAKYGVLPRLRVRARVQSERERFRWVRDSEVLGSVTVDRVREGSTPNGGKGYRELEVELQNGAGAALGEVRAAVEARLGLHATERSKLAASLAAQGTPLPELDESPFVLREGDRLTDVAVKTLARHLSRMLWNEPGTRLGVDPECLHDMRVATRRLRTALRVFDSMLRGETRDRFARDLRWIGRALGRVRDMEVGLEWVARMEAEASEPERAALRIFANDLEIRRARRRAKLLKRLDSARYTRFRKRARSWIEMEPRVWDAVPEKPARAKGAGAIGGITPALAPAEMVGPRIVAEWDARMREACAVAERAPTVANVHALRIAIKHARYAVEFFADLEGPGAHRRARALARLQNILGARQDGAMLHRLMRRYARRVPRRDRELRSGARGVLEAFERSARVKKRELREVWDLGAGTEVG